MLWKLELVAYNPSWPKLYQNAVRSLQLCLPMIVGFEHVNPITLRNSLRLHEETARRYLNRSPASRPYQNPSAYSAQKAEFLASVLTRTTAC